MNRGELLSCIESSLIRFIEDFRRANNPTATYFDWDAHASISDIPAGDVMGPAGIGLTDEGKILQLVFSFGLATTDDTNLFRLRALMSNLYGQLLPETRLSIYDPTGRPTSWMVIKSPVTVAPISKSQLRSIRFITAMAMVDPTGGVSS